MCDCERSFMDHLTRQEQASLPLWAIAEMVRRISDLDEDWDTAIRAVMRKLDE